MSTSTREGEAPTRQAQGPMGAHRKAYPKIENPRRCALRPCSAPLDGRQRLYCSEAHRIAVHRHGIDGPPARYCRWCRVEMSSAGGRRLCSQACRLAELRSETVAAKLELARQCAECAGPIPVERRSDARYCSAACLGAVVIRNGGTNPGRPARHRVRGARRLAVFQAAGWLCHICSTPIDPDARYPSPDSGEVEHLYPLCRGGDTVDDNLGAAHRRCNLAKRRDDLARPHLRGA